MPIYEYACNVCGEQFEKIQKMSDDPLVDCPHCNGPHLRKLVSAPAFRLKGEGWYETDFKSGKQKNLYESKDSKEPKSSEDGGKKNAVQGDAKPQSKQEQTSTTKPAS